MKIKVSAILLGAGESRRMGVNKLSLPWGRKTILEHCLHTLLRSEVGEVIVIMNPRMKESEKKFILPKCKVVINPYYQNGISTSIRMGVRAIDPQSQGILIALGDQPFLKTRTVNALIKRFAKQRKGIIVPSFRKEKGHPVIFHRTYQNELLKLKGDEGGKSILQKYSKEIWRVPVRSSGVVRDIDVRKDYKNL